ncbi:Acylphosphatase [Dipodascopsis uninucleata]
MESNKIKRIYFEVHGKVQGVGFRRFVWRSSAEIGNVTGWVMNTEHNTVKGEAQSELEHLEKVLKRLNKGSTYSTVSKVEYIFIDPITDESQFTIRKTQK